MNAKSIQADQVEIQDTATDRPHTDGQADDQADEYPLLPGFIRFYQDAQSNQHETGQLYVTIEADPLDMENSLADDIPPQRAKIYQR